MPYAAYILFTNSELHVYSAGMVRAINMLATNYHLRLNALNDITQQNRLLSFVWEAVPLGKDGLYTHRFSDRQHKKADFLYLFSML